MAPTPLLAHRDLGASDPGSRDPKEETGSGSKAWIIVAVIAGIVVIVTIIVFISIKIIRRKEFKRAKATNPALSGKEYSRRRKMTDIDRMEEEEEQRRMIIRKSMATRSGHSDRSSRRNDSVSSQSSILAPSPFPEMVEVNSASHNNIENSSTDTDTDTDTGDEGVSDNGPSNRSMSLKDDWKAYEARIQRERSNSGEMHPATSPPRIHGDLPVPTRSVTRSRSPSQTSLASQDLPPLPIIVPSPVGERVREGPEPMPDLGADAERRIPGIKVQKS